MVKCDGDEECSNGGWVHPQCTTDLKDKSKEDLDNLQEWYCEDCVARIMKEEEEDNEEQKDENELNYENGEDMQVDEVYYQNINEEDKNMIDEGQNQITSRKNSGDSNEDERSSSSSSSSDDDQDNILV